MPFTRKPRRLEDALNEQAFQQVAQPGPDGVVVPMDAGEYELRQLYANNPRTPASTEPQIEDSNYGGYPQGHPMRDEYDRQRREAMGMFQKLMAAYQSMRSRR